MKATAGGEMAICPILARCGKSQFVCLFVCLCVRQGEAINVSLRLLAKWVSLNWDSASRPRTFLMYFYPLMLLRGFEDEEKSKMTPAQKTPSENQIGISNKFDLFDWIQFR